MPSATELPPKLTSPPPPVPEAEIAFPRPNVLLVTLNRPAQLNAIPRQQHFALARLWDWYDEQPALRCAVFTGRGRAFCAGADLKEWDGVLGGGGGNGSDIQSNGGGTVVLEKTELTQDGTGAPGVALRSTTTSSGTNPDTGAGLDATRRTPPTGFGGLSNRGGKKPVIAAVNGICFGGGMEMALNCDLVVASARAARFALPEVAVGVVALAGALPRLARSVGRQRAMEMALSARRYGAREMREWGVVNEVVEDEGESEDGGKDGSGKGYGAVVEAALAWADRIAANSPDAVIVSREGVKMGWEGVNAEVATDLIIKGWYGRIEKGENMVEGVRSFVEKRKPVWKDSKL
ncbi:hypothetical protein SLS62_005980 [Diatrype stigma]|uniref:Enoyl-CoA hydratase n=1 Tax=Diatrype stigma TaxID=117547 RepID=A0AAN9V1V0_9PEZI